MVCLWGALRGYIVDQLDISASYFTQVLPLCLKFLLQFALEFKTLTSISIAKNLAFWDTETFNAIKALRFKKYM